MRNEQRHGADDAVDIGREIELADRRLLTEGIEHGGIEA